ncbi:hypothetical protein AKJ09_02577 [Labilithrix luteola]|uniref:Uncharacterized protein n=1 Tax=Labilithrix luteola TaxID=1391654 RepID=A0A0K1PQV7_9BACT|nr:hypothetical protein [Labilithrix luteola]AKU95913.1 hypothetical protein AKJ09_02577 [Labilithrix luteola]
MAAKNVLPSIDAWLAPRASVNRSAASGLGRGRLSPIVTAAAIRIPERVSSQLALVFPTQSPALFVHEGARQALERRLKAACPGRPVILSITDNRHSIISHSTRHGVLHARVHHMFLDAPPRVVEALARYVARGDRKASMLVGQYIDASGSRLARRRPRAIPLVAKGKHHDLLAIFSELNERYFDGGCHALITWGRKAGRKAVEGKATARKTIKLGSYAHLERLIRIHPVLDKPWVPRYFVEYVVYHEMLHHMIPTARGSVRASTSNLASAKGQLARRVLHPPEFLERERHFRKYERALDWERRHIGRLLRAS